MSAGAYKFAGLIPGVNPSRWCCRQKFQPQHLTRGVSLSAGAYRFAGLISDTYIIQVVLPAAGANQSMRFAQRRVGRGVSNVSSAGQSYVLTVGSTSIGVDALIQVIS